MDIGVPSGGSLTADQWLLLATVYGPIVVRISISQVQLFILLNINPLFDIPGPSTLGVLVANPWGIELTHFVNC